MKRGLFNFVGALTHQLFGTATTSEVLKVGELLSIMMHNNQAVNHVGNELTTVVNQSPLSTKENHDVIIVLTKETGDSIKHIDYVGNLGGLITRNEKYHQTECSIENAELLAVTLPERYYMERNPRCFIPSRTPHWKNNAQKEEHLL